MKKELDPSTMYWEDRLVKEGKHDEAVKALKRFRQGSRNRAAQITLFDKLVSLGMTNEEADEIVNLEMAE